ncbi:septal ring lytic transglycosylase RlpA family protein [Roseibacterium beibuensis]|uniref:septal ring lytic transglycosylase RlpA family protein n=1 Tax=[Roseibacterium] beibuensis TaxID=1193142 RepID=UPI00217E5D33|nr:septal ring lytic transglycosylase RlpA family protein [Roseibacterium beibuensis]MCS6625173.1 septal ring lytic transglycosylase RlpA family protein [Roseibacterium beibuensis]
MAAKLLKGVLVGAMLSLLAACASGAGSASRPALPVVTDPAPIVSGTMRPYQIRGRWYRPEEQPDYDETGMASWYGDQFHGRPTATGERFDMNALTAAHKTLPLPGLVEVTNLANGRTVVLRVNDRGPFVDGRIIDLSRGAADALDLRRAGVGEVRVRYLGRAPRLGGGQVLQYAEARPAPDRGPVPYLPTAVPPAQPQPGPAAWSPPAAPRTGVWVQAGTWADAREARRAASHLGGGAAVEEAAPGRYRVLVGPWPDAGTAERSRRAVISRGYPEATTISGG